MKCRYSAMTGLIAGILSCSALADGAGTGFVYQGQLRTTANHSRVNGDTDFRFSLWDAETGGTQIGITLEFSVDPNAVGLPIAVSKGLFQADLDFGVGAFDGSARWLAIEMRHPSDPTDTAPFDPISARQKLNPAPYAVYSVGQSTLSAPDGDPARAVYVDQSGKVGIGTTEPTATLHVAGNIAADGLVDGVDISAHAASSNAHHTPPTTLPPTGPAGGDLSGTYPNPAVNNDSHTHGDTTVSDTLSINNGRLYAPAGAGSVGIGTTSPASKLHVSGGDIRLDNNTSLRGSGAMFIYCDAGNELYLQPFSGTGRTVIGNPGFGGEGNAVIWGHVGVGTWEDPTYQLNVAGGIRCNGSEVCSDERFKTDVQPLCRGLNSVATLRPVRFDWRCDEFPHRSFTDRPQIGFIAQEVLDVVPEVVTQGSDGYYAVDYGRLTPVLVGATQELHGIVQQQAERIDRQDREITGQRTLIGNQAARIANQSAQIAALEARLTELESLVATLAATQTASAASTETPEESR